MGEDLSQLERQLADCVARGEVLDCAPEGTTSAVIEAVDDWGARLIRADTLARIATGASADRPDRLRRGVRLRGALIVGQLDLAHADLDAPIVLDVCRFEEPVELTGARVRSLGLTRCKLPALGADELETDHSLRLDHTTFGAGPIRLVGARIGGDLELTGAKLVGTDRDGNAVAGDGLRVGGGVQLRSGFEAAGAVRLWGADIGAQLDLRGARLTGSDASGDALVADEIHVGANALLTEGFEAAGAVRFPGARIDGNLELNGATLSGTDTFGNALRADRLHVRGNLLMRDGFQALGEIRLLGATIDGHLALVRARHVRRLVVQNARCGSVRHERDSWPPAGELVLQGFRFGRLVEDTGWRERLVWVRRQGFTHWSPDPYEQLAEYYTSVGDESASRRIRIARHDDELRHLRTVKQPGSLAYRFWRRPFGWLVGYGYRRWPAGLLLVVTLLAAGVVFRAANETGAMIPSHPSTVPGQPATVTGDREAPCGDAHPCFNALIYGADVVLPVIDFGQDSAWRPAETTAWGRGAAAARWAFITVGWVLASVFVAAFTRLVQRD